MANDPGMTVLSSGASERKFPFSIAVIAGLLVIGAALIALLVFSSRPKSPASEAASEDAPGYASQLTLSDLHLSAEANFLGQQVTYLDGKITNAGARTVQQLKLRLFFRDDLNQVVLREDHDLIGGQQPLGPGQARAFQVRFDQIPDSWNRQVPYLQLISLRVQ